MIEKLTLLFLTVLANVATPEANDRGPLPERERQTPISVTLTLALPGLAGVEKLQQAIYTLGAPEYHQFLTADQFAARFGPRDASRPTIPAEISKAVTAVFGLDNRPAAYSQAKTRPRAIRPALPGTKPPTTRQNVCPSIRFRRRPVSQILRFL